MTVRGSWLIAIAGICAALVRVQAQTPVFRAAADAVTVNVSVKKGNMPVAGLTAGDFRLSDNDVAQAISAISQDAVPVDVSIVVGGGWEDLEVARDAVRGMTALLRPADRVRVLTLGNSVVNAVPWQSPGPVDTSGIRLVPGRISAIADAVLIALFHRTSPDRRHLVVVLAYSGDFCSMVTAEELKRGAERSGAVLHWRSVGKRVLLTDDPTRTPMRVAGLPQGAHAWCRWTPFDPFEMGPSLTDAVRSTGGTVGTLVIEARKAAIDAFDQIFEDFRRSYLLHYVPTGVERSGFHRLRVETTTKGYSVRARPGYWGTGAADGRAKTPNEP